MKTRLAVLLLLLALNSCSYMTARGRREHAYEHYVRKHAGERYKHLAKKKFHLPGLHLRHDEPAMEADVHATGGSPQSISASATNVTASSDQASPQ